MTDNDTPYYKSVFVPTSEEIYYLSNHFLKYIKYEIPINKNYKPWEKTEHKRKKTFYKLFAFFACPVILEF